MLNFFMAPVYIGVMGGSTRIENSKLLGDSVEILCNPLTKPNKEVLCSVRYNTHPSYLEVLDSFTLHESHPGASVFSTYLDILRDIFNGRKTVDPVIVLFDQGDFSRGYFLKTGCSSDRVCVARFPGGLGDTLKSVGRDFMKEI